MSPLALLKVIASLVVVFCCLLCVREELLPLSCDADEGCQWEVQTDEGWASYWDP
jgi:hypothetical protein